MSTDKTSVRFFVGLHQPGDAQHFDLACISINRLRGRKKPVECEEVLVDSGAFTELNLYGGYRHGVEEYASELYRLYVSGIVKISAAVAQDYMCEPFMLEKTGLTVGEHQRLTVERYDALKAELDRLFGGECPFPVMPVLQGYAPSDYVRHVPNGRLATRRSKPQPEQPFQPSPAQSAAPPERTQMNAQTLEALKASIAKWERNAEATYPFDYKIGDEDCPLCNLFIDNINRCEGCPVFERTGKRFCEQTPYIAAHAARYAWREGFGPADRAHAAARDEVAFLKSLLPVQP